MGAVTIEYRASANLTVTALHSLATSAGLLGGWTSEIIDNTVNKDEDVLISAKFTLAAAGLAAGSIQVWAYAMLDDTNWPDVFSAGTEGTEGTATIHDDEQKSEAFRLLWSCATDTGASEVHNMPPSSIASLFGSVMPAKCALFVSHNTGAALAAAGNQVTKKGIYRSVV